MTFELSKIEKIIRDESQKDETSANNKTVSSAPEDLHNNSLSKLIFALTRYVKHSSRCSHTARSPNTLQMFIQHL